jgi:hypothetical protein
MQPDNRTKTASNGNQARVVMALSIEFDPKIGARHLEGVIRSIVQGCDFQSVKTSAAPPHVPPQKTMAKAMNSLADLISTTDRRCPTSPHMSQNSVRFEPGL